MPHAMEPIEEVAICGRMALENLLRLQQAMRELGNYRGETDVSSAVGCLIAAMERVYGRLGPAGENPFPGENPLH